MSDFAQLDNETSIQYSASNNHGRNGFFPSEKAASVELNGIITEIICASFSDHNLIIITQINKIGTVLRAWTEPKSGGGDLYKVSTLLGKRDDALLTIYARQLIERISNYSPKPLIVMVSLKDEGRGRDFFEAIVNKVLETIVL